jgi:hypothetical protein
MNPITNPNPIYNHNTRDNMFVSVTFRENLCHDYCVQEYEAM